MAKKSNIKRQMEQLLQRCQEAAAEANYNMAQAHSEAWFEEITRFSTKEEGPSTEDEFPHRDSGNLAESLEIRYDITTAVAVSGVNKSEAPYGETLVKEMKRLGPVAVYILHQQMIAKTGEFSLKTAMRRK